MTKQRQKILVVTAVPFTIRVFLLPYLKVLARDYDVTVVCSDHEPNFSDHLPQGVIFNPVTIARKIECVQDALALINLFRIIHFNPFKMVHSVTPKAGLLTQLVAKMAGVPCRLHIFTGQVWVTRTGPMRWLLKTLDRVTASCATHVLTDSATQRMFLIEQGIVSRDKIQVIGHGSISGVDLTKFRPDKDIRASLRAEYRYNENAILALYVGRLNRAKGILDLVHAFVRISIHTPDLHLIIVGPDEEFLANEIEQISRGNLNIKLIGPTAHPERFMAASDFFCLPSYREGFGSVVIEAAACGIPAVASRIYGLTDAVEEGKSGILYEPGNIAELEAALMRVTLNEAERLEMGAYACSRAKSHFSQDVVIEEQIAFIKRIISDGK